MANVRRPSSTGGTAVSGSTAMPAPAATRSAMRRMPSTSTGTSSCTPRRAAAASISSAERIHPRREDEAVARQVGHRERALADVGRRGRQADHRLVGEMLEDDARVLCGRGHDGERELAGHELAEEPLGRALVHEQSHAGRALREVLHELGDEPPARGAHHAEGRVPDLQPLERGELLVQQVQLPSDPPRPCQHDPARLRGRRAAAPAGEQRDPELGLELADLVGHVRLHRAQRVGRRGERALLVDGHEGVEMAQLHGVPFAVLRGMKPLPPVTHR